MTGLNLLEELLPREDITFADTNGDARGHLVDFIVCVSRREVTGEDATREQSALD